MWRRRWRVLSLPLEQDLEAPAPAFAGSVWVYACVQCIASNLSRCRYELRGAHAEHPLRLALEEPWEEGSFADLLERTTADLLLTGSAFWLLEGGFPPARLLPFTGDQVFRTERGYRIGEREFPRKQVLAFRLYHPGSREAGLSPLRPLEHSLWTDRQILRYYREFFRKGLFLRGYFYSPRDLPEPLLSRLKEHLRQVYAGWRGWTQVPILTGGLEFRTLATAPAELAWSAWREELRKDVLAAFRVPPILLGLDTANYATARAQKATFWRETLLPLLRKLELRIQRGLVAPTAEALGERLEFRFLLPEDVQQTLAEE